MVGGLQGIPGVRAQWSVDCLLNRKSEQFKGLFPWLIKKGHFSDSEETLDI